MSIIDFTLDVSDWFIRLFKNKLYLPPRKLRMRIGQSSKDTIFQFEAAGYYLVELFKNLCNLKPEESVLDIGCGCGRTTIPLTKYIGNKGIYYGMDVEKNFIDWCQKHITPKYHNFNFLYANLYRLCVLIHFL